jgi:hypothetical protein
MKKKLKYIEIKTKQRGKTAKIASLLVCVLLHRIIIKIYEHKHTHSQLTVIEPPFDFYFSHLIHYHNKNSNFILFLIFFIKSKIKKKVKIKKRKNKE